MELSSQTVLITGGASGIGLALAVSTYFCAQSSIDCPA